MEKFLNEILHGDCLKLLKDIPTESVDAIITDPPYGIDYQSCCRKDKSKRHPKIANDKNPFIWWLYDANRVLKKDGALICFCRWDVQNAFKSAIEWAGFTIKSQVIWDKVLYGAGDLKASFAPGHEVIWFAVKNKFIFPGKRPRSVITCQRINGSQLIHPNEKPVNLMEQLIQSITKEKEIVLDPFLGSGSTAVAAINTGRFFVGIEKEYKYVEISNCRVQQAYKEVSEDRAKEVGVA